ncbi:MAG: conserved membrane protein of unknown function [Candidatus Thorarchaeota archaeon]|nr:MAG: conserved membrane protein of unknown function [Candidatus Thorarchaeota archaeon]
MTEIDECSVESDSEFISIRKVVAFVLIGIILYLSITLISNVEDIAAALIEIQWWWVLPTMMLLSFGNYLFRYIKWQYYLQKIDVNLCHKDSFTIFLAGFTLTTTPGKVGEAIKGVFCNEVDGAPVAKTMPVVVSERVTDLLAMVLLAMIGFVIGVTTENQLLQVLMLGGLVLVGAIILGRPAFYNKIVKKMTTIGPLKRFEESCDLIEDTMTKTLAPKAMFFTTLVSIPGWFFECLELWLLLSLLSGAGLPSLTVPSLILLLQATFIHSTASIIGALSFTPGGLVGYEAVSIFLITTLLGFQLADASVATILIRFVTLWFSVIVGFLALGVLTRMNRKREQAAVHQA